MVYKSNLSATNSWMPQFDLNACLESHTVFFKLLPCSWFFMSMEAHCQRSRLAFVSPRPFKWVWCRWDHTRSNLICMQLQDGYHLFLQTCVAQKLSQKLVIQTLNSATKNHRDLCEDHTWSEMVVGENRQRVKQRHLEVAHQSKSWVDRPTRATAIPLPVCACSQKGHVVCFAATLINSEQEMLCEIILKIKKTLHGRQRFWLLLDLIHCNWGSYQSFKWRLFRLMSTNMKSADCLHLTFDISSSQDCGLFSRGVGVGSGSHIDQLSTRYTSKKKFFFRVCSFVCPPSLKKASPSIRWTKKRNRPQGLELHPNESKSRALCLPVKELMKVRL